MNFKRLSPALLIVFSNLIGATIVLPILPLFAIQQLGGTPFQAILLDTAYYGAKFVAAPFLGRLSDRYGRRPILIASQTGTVLSFILFLFALPLGRHLDGLGLSLGLSGGLFVLYLARLLDGATGGNTIIAQAYVADITSEENRAQALGLLSAALGVGFIFGPAVGGFLAARWGMLAPFVGGAVIATASLVLTTAVLQESLPVGVRSNLSQQKRSRLALKSVVNMPAFLAILAVSFIITVSFASISPTFTLYADQVLFADVVDTTIISRNVGLMFMLMGLTAAVTQGLLIKPLVARWGEWSVVLAGQTILLLTSFLIPFTNQPVLFMMGLLPFVFAYGITDPTLQALVTRFGDGQIRGQMLGFYQSSLSLAYLVGPIGAGFLFQQVRPQAVWWGTAVLFLLAILLSRVLIYRPMMKRVQAHAMGSS
jgi:DHA1 family tetracycline resistance protein-like MFS transporter